MAPRLISERDYADFGQILRAWRAGELAPRPRGGPPEDPTAPEVYVARVPHSGIPALAEHTLGPGTGAVVLDDRAYTALCDIYRVSEDGFFHPCGFNKYVYNLSRTAVEGDSWVPTWREKFGRWVTTGAYRPGVLTYVSDVCLDWVNHHVIVEYTTIDLATGEVLAVACRTDAGDCCGGTEFPPPDTGTGTGTGSGTTGPGGGSCCDLFRSPRPTLCARLSSSDCPCLDGKRITLRYTVLQPGNQGVYIPDGPLSHSCGSGGFYSVGVVSPCTVQIAMTGGISESINSTGAAALTVHTCSPLLLTAEVEMTQTGAGVSLCAGTVTVTITEGECDGDGPGGTGTGTGDDGGGTGTGGGGGGDCLGGGTKSVTLIGTGSCACLNGTYEVVFDSETAGRGGGNTACGLPHLNVDIYVSCSGDSTLNIEVTCGLIQVWTGSLPSRDLPADFGPLHSQSPGVSGGCCDDLTGTLSAVITE